MNLRPSIVWVVLGPLLLLGSCLVVSSFLGWLPSQQASEERGIRGEVPEEVARRSVCPGSSLPLDYNVRGTTRSGPDRIVFVYDAVCPPGERSPSGRFAGFATVVHELGPYIQVGDRIIWGERYWRAVGAPGYRLQPSLPPSGEHREPERRGGFVRVEVWGSGEAGGVPHAFVGGVVLAPDRVATIEAVLEDGRTITGATDRDVFFVYAEDANEIREVRVLDRAGNPLQRLSDPYGPDGGAAPPVGLCATRRQSDALVPGSSSLSCGSFVPPLVL